MEPEKTKTTHDPFLQRAVEHWLDSANELGYQPLFCEWLITQGHVLKYSIKNTNFEQGKDVVSVNAAGVPQAYQLKGGNINLTRWRSEVKPEIEALIDCTIEHPDIEKGKSHVSYLVTNGDIDDSVRVEIVNLNGQKWANNPLHVWTRGDLLTGFQAMADGILPKDAEMYKKLIDLIFADGTGSPDFPKVYSFLLDILNTKNNGISKEQRKRDISAAILYVTMVVGPYRKLKNHASVVRILVLLLSLVFYVADKYSLDDKYWIESYKIVWNDILNTAKLLEKEINEDGFDSSHVSPYDADLMPFRKHSAVSIIHALKLSQVIADNEDWKTMLDPKVSAKYQKTILVWGESSFIPFIFLTLIFRNVKGAEAQAAGLSQNVVSQILEFNGRKSKHPVGLVPPYYDVDFAVKLSFDLLEENFEEKYKLSSYIIKPTVDLLSRLNQREFISNNWKEISFMHFEEFVPTDSIDYYLWRSEKGENLTSIPKKEKSWAELVSEAKERDGKNLPVILKRFPEFLPFLIAVFPHRLNSGIMGFLFSVSEKEPFTPPPSPPPASA